MGIIGQNDQVIWSSEELRLLAEAEEYYQLSLTPGWVKLKGEMVKMIQDSLERVANCESNDVRVQANITDNWKMTRKAVLAILSHVDEMVAYRKTMMEEQNEYTSSNAPGD